MDVQDVDVHIWLGTGEKHSSGKNLIKGVRHTYFAVIKRLGLCSDHKVQRSISDYFPFPDIASMSAPERLPSQISISDMPDRSGIIILQARFEFPHFQHRLVSKQRL